MKKIIINDQTPKCKPKRICSYDYKGGYQIEKAISAIEKKEQEFKNSIKSEDTIVRTQIHSIIIKMIKQGKNKQAILEMLNSVPEYMPFSAYFEDWITARQRKAQDEIQAIAKVVTKQMLRTGEDEKTVLERIYRQEKSKERLNPYAIRWIENRIERLQQQER